MAETFKERIEALTGFTAINGTNKDDSISEWLNDGVKELMSIMPKDKLGDMASTATVTNSLGQNLDAVSGANILAVSRKDENLVKQTCRKSFPHLASRMEDHEDIMFSSTSDPVYYNLGGTIHILPTPTSSQSAEVMDIPIPSVSHGDFSIGSDYLSATGVTSSLEQGKLGFGSSTPPANPWKDYFVHGYPLNGEGGRLYISVRLSNFIKESTGDLYNEVNGMVGYIIWADTANSFGVNGLGDVGNGDDNIPSLIGGKVESVVGCFPDEYEYIIVLYASVKAAQSLLASEEDDDLYTPMINTLKSDYVQAVNLLGGKMEQPKKASSDKKQIESLQKLLAQGQ